MVGRGRLEYKTLKDLGLVGGETVQHMDSGRYFIHKEKEGLIARHVKNGSSYQPVDSSFRESWAVVNFGFKPEDFL